MRQTAEGQGNRWNGLRRLQSAVAFFRGQVQPPAMSLPWTDTLANFLRAQPGIEGLRIDTERRKVSIATLGEVDLDLLEASLLSWRITSAIAPRLRPVSRFARKAA
jgi:hypothetical protein